MVLYYSMFYALLSPFIANRARVYWHFLGGKMAYCHKEIPFSALIDGYDAFWPRISSFYWNYPSSFYVIYTFHGMSKNIRGDIIQPDGDTLMTLSLNSYYLILILSTLNKFIRYVWLLSIKGQYGELPCYS